MEWYMRRFRSPFMSVRVWLSLLLVAGLATTASAAEVVLKSGTVLRGEIVEKTDTHVTVKVFMGAYVNKKVPLDTVKEIKGETPTAAKPASGGAATGSPAAAAGATALGQGLGFGWRGDGSGVFPETNPPSSWSTTENVAWTCKLPAAGFSSPCLAAGKVFLTCEPDLLVCVNQADGKILWQQTSTYADAGVPDASEPSPDWLKAYGLCTPTPASDGKVVVASFGSGIVTAFDLEGKRLWIKHYPASNKVSGTACSPRIFKDKVFVAYPSKQGVCLSLQTGAEVWSARVHGGYGTGVVTSVGGKDLLVTCDGQVFDAHSGAQMQKGMLGEARENWGPSAIVGGGMVYLHCANKGKDGGEICAWKLGANLEQAWKIDTAPFHGSGAGRGGRFHASPVYHDGICYWITCPGCLVALDAQTGKLLYQEDLGLKKWTSLCIAGGKLWCFKSQRAIVVEPGSTFKKLAEFGTGVTDANCSTPIFVGSRVYQRDHQNLYCFGK
jgi:outer membrane protein assembly factor BamB